MSRIRVLLTAAVLTVGSLAVHAMTDEGRIPLSEGQLDAIRGTADGNPQKKNSNGQTLYSNCADQNDTESRNANCRGRNNGISCIYCAEPETQPVVDPAIQVQAGYVAHGVTDCTGNIYSSICNDGECQAAGSTDTQDSCASTVLPKYLVQTPPAGG